MITRHIFNFQTAQNGFCKMAIAWDVFGTISELYYSLVRRHEKESKLELKNYRGIFTLPALRQILDKLTYNDKYSDLEESMSDSNIGSLKFKNIRNHLFMVYGIINDVFNGKGLVLIYKFTILFKHLMHCG